MFSARNFVSLEGNIGSVDETKMTKDKNGNQTIPMTRCSLAVTQGKETMWIRGVGFRGVSDQVAALQKGDKAMLVGKLMQRDKNAWKLYKGNEDKADEYVKELEFSLDLMAANKVKVWKKGEWDEMKSGRGNKQQVDVLEQLDNEIEADQSGQEETGGDIVTPF